MHRGDHIQINRGGYYHHGIDLGDGTVIHFSGEPMRKSNAVIRRSLMIEFIGDDGEYSVVNYPPIRCLPPDEVVARAFSFLGQRLYNLVFRNCEHFATYCKTGEWKSAQVNNTLKRMALKWSRFGLINPWLFVAAPVAVEIVRAGALKAIHEITKPLTPHYNGLSYLASMYVDPYSNVFLLDGIGNWWQAGQGNLWHPNCPPQFTVNLVGHIINRSGQPVLVTNAGAFTLGNNGQWIRLE